jgi:hypothetical protein
MATKKWDLENPGRKNELARAAYARKKEASGKPTNRDYKLWQKYSITQEDYDRMLKEQGHKCAVCSRPPAPRRALAVDHCHEHEEHGVMLIRGLLCTSCNNHLGYFEKFRDEIEDYLGVTPLAQEITEKVRARRSKNALRMPHIDMGIINKEMYGV